MNTRNWRRRKKKKNLRKEQNVGFLLAVRPVVVPGGSCLVQVSRIAFLSFGGSGSSYPPVTCLPTVKKAFFSLLDGDNHKPTRLQGREGARDVTIWFAPSFTQLSHHTACFTAERLGRSRFHSHLPSRGPNSKIKEFSLNKFSDICPPSSLFSFFPFPYSTKQSCPTNQKISPNRACATATYTKTKQNNLHLHATFASPHTTNKPSQWVVLFLVSKASARLSAPS